MTESARDMKFDEGASHKNSVLTLVERDGPARAFAVEPVKMHGVLPIVRIVLESCLMTDETVQYAKLSDEFAKHCSVVHQPSQYGRRVNQHQHRGGVLRHPQARYDRCIATLRRASFAPLARGI
jgi:hypothetical protein